MTAAVSSRVWLITGCSTGFGRHLTEAALEKGDRVIATARQVGQIRDLRQMHPKTAVVCQLDVTDIPSIDAALQSGLDAFGRIDVLVNNAGYGLSGAIEETTDQQMRDQFETNVFGVLNVTRAVLPTLKKQRAGHILNVSSVGGRLAVPAMGAYHGSKFALEGLSEALAHELKPFGIKVIILEPGGFATDFGGRSLVRAAPLPEYEWLRAEMAAFGVKYTRGHAPTGVQAILKVVELADPPVRLALGPNSPQRLIEKLNADIAEYKRYEEMWRPSAANEIVPAKPS